MNIKLCNINNKSIKKEELNESNILIGIIHSNEISFDKIYECIKNLINQTFFKINNDDLGEEFKTDNIIFLINSISNFNDIEREIFLIPSILIYIMSEKFDDNNLDNLDIIIKIENKIMSNKLTNQKIFNVIHSLEELNFKSFPYNEIFLKKNYLKNYSKELVKLNKILYQKIYRTVFPKFNIYINKSEYQIKTIIFLPSYNINALDNLDEENIYYKLKLFSYYFNIEGIKENYSTKILGCQTNIQFGTYNINFELPFDIFDKKFYFFEKKEKTYENGFLTIIFEGKEII